MKRYWKIISICLVTLLVIGTFYIQSSFATNEHLKIEFEKVNGNEGEVENLILFGDYSVGHIYQPLQITSEETIDPTNLPFLRQLERITIPPMLEGLVKQYRNFMRGKDMASTYFFEDENRIAYANIKAKNHVHPMKDLTFDIEVLTKKSEEVTSIRLDVPERESYFWMQVEDVQVIDDEVKVIARSSRITNGDELRVYTFDLNKQKLVTDDTIASIPMVENGWSDLRIVNDYYSIQRNKYLLIKVEAFEDDMGHSDGEPNVVANEFIVYDIENNQSKKIVAPAEILGSIGGDSAISKSTIYIPSQSANGVEVNQYDIENEKWDEKRTFDLVDNKDEESPYMKVMNEKLYVIHLTNNGHSIFIGDLKTGESLYEGKLKMTNQGEDQKDYRLYFHEIEYVQ
ncbi:hypothetical protein [Sporosarcina sp. JAI121]|uniref:hypothetical protein n=1 Tax=Sporosarcina sp. JAI121 TaxID=2723064 RepID=UPI0015C86C40|nr:hypothetical protein [Sporosarcina sp. JAI121]NYF26091.1 hypothetical protein [Sporosarcina sp. JAI121]